MVSLPHDFWALPNEKGYFLVHCHMHQKKQVTLNKKRITDGNILSELRLDPEDVIVRVLSNNYHPQDITEVSKYVYLENGDSIIGIRDTDKFPTFPGGCLNPDSKSDRWSNLLRIVFCDAAEFNARQLSAPEKDYVLTELGVKEVSMNFGAPLFHVAEDDGELQVGDILLHYDYGNLKEGLSTVGAAFFLRIIPQMDTYRDVWYMFDAPMTRLTQGTTFKPYAGKTKILCPLYDEDCFYEMVVKVNGKLIVQNEVHNNFVEIPWLQDLTISAQKALEQISDVNTVVDGFTLPLDTMQLNEINIQLKDLRSNQSTCTEDLLVVSDHLMAEYGTLHLYEPGTVLNNAAKYGNIRARVVGQLHDGAVLETFDTTVANAEGKMQIFHLVHLSRGDFESSGTTKIQPFSNASAGCKYKRIEYHGTNKDINPARMLAPMLKYDGELVIDRSSHGESLPSELFQRGTAAETYYYKPSELPKFQNSYPPISVIVPTKDFSTTATCGNGLTVPSKNPTKRGVYIVESNSRAKLLIRPSEKYFGQAFQYFSNRFPEMRQKYIFIAFFLYCGVTHVAHVFSDSTMTEAFDETLTNMEMMLNEIAPNTFKKHRANDDEGYYLYNINIIGDDHCNYKYYDLMNAAGNSFAYEISDATAFISMKLKIEATCDTTSIDILSESVPHACCFDAARAYPYSRILKEHVDSKWEVNVSLIDVTTETVLRSTRFHEPYGPVEAPLIQTSNAVHDKLVTTTFSKKRTVFDVPLISKHALFDGDHFYVVMEHDTYTIVNPFQVLRDPSYKIVLLNSEEIMEYDLKDPDPIVPHPREHGLILVRVRVHGNTTWPPFRIACISFDKNYNTHYAAHDYDVSPREGAMRVPNLKFTQIKDKDHFVFLTFEIENEDVLMQHAHFDENSNGYKKIAQEVISWDRALNLYNRNFAISVASLPDFETENLRVEEIVIGNNKGDEFTIEYQDIAGLKKFHVNIKQAEVTIVNLTDNPIHSHIANYLKYDTVRGLVFKQRHLFGGSYNIVRHDITRASSYQSSVVDKSPSNKKSIFFRCEGKPLGSFLECRKHAFLEFWTVQWRAPLEFWYRTSRKEILSTNEFQGRFKNYKVVAECYTEGERNDFAKEFAPEDTPSYRRVSDPIPL